MKLFRWLKEHFKPRLRILPSVAAYHLWAENYPATAHNPLMHYEQEAMLNLLPDLRGKTVLDLACGTGRYGRIALERGAQHVFGLDNSAAMLKRSAVPDVVEASSEYLPVRSESVDVVVCGLALGHLPQLEPSLAEIRRVLTQDGVALISDFHPFQALRGAQRSFTAGDGSHYAVEHYVHLYSDYHRAARENGLEITEVAEPALANTHPLVLVLRLRKAG